MGWAGVCRMGGIGDNLIVSSVLPGLKAKFGNVEVITKAPFHTIFHNNPHVDKLTVKDDKDIPMSSNEDWQNWFVNRGKEYDAFYHLSHSCEIIRALFPAQTQFWWPASMRRKLCGQSYLETVHDICELSYSPIGARFYPTEEEIARAQQDKAEKLRNGRSGPIIGWVCSGTRIDKRHPRAGFVAARLIRELDATFVLFGGWEKDRAIAEEIERQVRQQNGDTEGLKTCISISKEQDIWPIRRSLTQLQLCDVVGTPDTGPAWAVSMCPIPKVVIVSHASAENITKHWVNTTTLAADPVRVPCHPCHRLHTDNTTCVPNQDNDGPACTSDVTVEVIVRSVTKALEGTLSPVPRRQTDLAFTVVSKSQDVGGDKVMPISTNGGIIESLPWRA
jgi:ADP-heptose:LPS heptosyltransferase